MDKSTSQTLQYLASEVLPTNNFEEWLANDGLANHEHNERGNEIYLEELELVKNHFRFGVNNRSALVGKDGINLSPIEIYNLIEGYLNRIKKLRLVIKPEYSIGCHLHKIKTSHGLKEINYLLVRSYWIGADGRKYRKFSKNLGAEDKVLVSGQIPGAEMDKIINELVHMSWDQYKREYRLFVIEPSIISSEFQHRLNKIDLLNDEDYDCTVEDVWSYRKATDIRNGINIKFGNMANGFPFEIEGVRFHNSECAYIAGAYASNNETCLSIQKKIATEKNGYLAKRIYRNQQEFTGFIRDDFHEYNVQWMLFVLWEKCIGNPEFAALLKSIPLDAHLVENTSSHKGKTALFWGAKNMELKSYRDKVESEVEKQNSSLKKNKLDFLKMIESNKINNIGHFTGKNVMGKIIKICQICLIYNQNPPIDYALLNNKELFWYGRKVDFNGEAMQ